MEYRVGVKDRKVVGKRIITKMIAEWALRFSLVRRHLTDQRKFGFGEQTMTAADGIVDRCKLCARQQRGKHKFADTLRKRSDSRQYQGRRSAHINRHGQRLVTLLGFVIMESTAFADLPMHTGRCSVVSLHAVDAEIMFAVVRTLGVNETKRVEIASVF